MTGLSISGTSTGSSLPPIFDGNKGQLMKKSKGLATAGDSKLNKKANAEMAAMRESCEMNNNRGGKLSTPPASGGATLTTMKRAKQWSPQVENAYRLQLAGFRAYEEYIQTYPEPELWPETGFVKCLQSKTTGYFLYFRSARECEDKHMNKVKLYS